MAVWIRAALSILLLAGARLMPDVMAAAGMTLADTQLAFAAVFTGAVFVLFAADVRLRRLLGRLSARRLLLAAASGLGLFAAGMLGYAATVAVYSQMGWGMPQALSYFDVRGAYGTGALLAFVAASAVLEETVFRGIILDRLRTRAPAFFAILISSACFAAYHLDGFQLAATFIWGVGLGILLVRTNTLSVPIAAHLTFNFVSVALFASGAFSAP